MTSPVRPPKGHALINTRRLQSVRGDVERFVSDRLTEDARSASPARAKADPWQLPSPSMERPSTLRSSSGYTRFGETNNAGGEATTMTSRLKPHCIATCSKLPHCLPSYITEAFCGRVIIPEEGSWKQMWDVMVLMLILYSGLIVPFRICFDAPASGLAWGIELFISLTFWRLWLFRTAYLVDDSWSRLPAPSRITTFAHGSGRCVSCDPARTPRYCLKRLVDVIEQRLEAAPAPPAIPAAEATEAAQAGRDLGKAEDILDIDLRIMQLFVLLIKVLCWTPSCLLLVRCCRWCRGWPLW